MATTVENLKAETSTVRRIIVAAVILLGIFITTGLFLALNYWLAVTFFFSSLLIFIRFNLDDCEARGLWLLIILSLFVAVLAGSLALLFLSNNLGITQLDRSGAIVNIFLGSNTAIVFTSILIGLIATIIVVILPFLSLVAFAAIGILKWHKKDEYSSFFGAFWYLLDSVLGLSCFSIIVSNGEIKGTDKDKVRLERFGGPGRLIVYPGQVVILHHWGKFTRAVGAGSTILKRAEQIKAVVWLTPRVKPNNAKPDDYSFNQVKNVLTQDRIPLHITVIHAAQLEPASDTRNRFQQAVDSAQSRVQALSADASSEEKQKAQQELDQAKEQLQALTNDKIIGDDYNQCYESIAKLVAAKGADVWEASRSAVANNLRDAIMSERFEDLFKISEVTEDLVAKVSQRKILEIENLVFEKAKETKIKDGIVLKVVDIQTVEFPEKIAIKLSKEVETLIEERIQQTNIRLKESAAKRDIIEAKAKAQARMLAVQGEGEARAAAFREILRELKREESLPRDQIASTAIRLMSIRSSNTRRRSSTSRGSSRPLSSRTNRRRTTTDNTRS